MVSVETLILEQVLVVFVRRERYVWNLYRLRTGKGEDESLLLFSFMRLSSLPVQLPLLSVLPTLINLDRYRDMVWIRQKLIQIQYSHLFKSSFWAKAIINMMGLRLVPIHINANLALVTRGVCKDDRSLIVHVLRGNNSKSTLLNVVKPSKKSWAIYSKWEQKEF